MKPSLQDRLAHAEHLVAHFEGVYQRNVECGTTPDWAVDTIRWYRKRADVLRRKIATLTPPPSNVIRFPIERVRS